MNPNTGYRVATTTVDGTRIVPSSSYTFTNVTTDHTISATFETPPPYIPPVVPVPTPTPTPVVTPPTTTAEPLTATSSNRSVATTATSTSASRDDASEMLSHTTDSTSASSPLIHPYEQALAKSEQAEMATSSDTSSSSFAVVELTRCSAPDPPS